MTPPDSSLCTYAAFWFAGLVGGRVASRIVLTVVVVNVRIEINKVERHAMAEAISNDSSCSNESSSGTR